MLRGDMGENTTLDSLHNLVNLWIRVLFRLLGSYCIPSIRVQSLNLTPRPDTVKYDVILYVFQYSLNIQSTRVTEINTWLGWETVMWCWWGGVWVE